MIQAHAELVTIVGGVLVGLAGGAIAGLTAGMTKNYIENYDNIVDIQNQQLIDKINNGAIQNGELIQIEYDRTLNTMTWQPVDNLNEHDRAFAEYISSYMNTNAPHAADILMLQQEGLITDNAVISSETYSEIKTAATNAFIGYWNDKVMGEAFFGNNILDDYQHNFNYPTGASFNIPESYGTLNVDGFILTKPEVIYTDGTRIKWTEEQAKSGKLFDIPFNASESYKSYGLWNIPSTVYITNHPSYDTCYHTGQYIVYDGNIYFADRGWSRTENYAPPMAPDGYSNFHDKDGNSFSDTWAKIDKSDYSDGYYPIVFGFYLDMVEEDGRDSPIEIVSSEDELKTGGGTGSLAPSLTDDELSVGQAQLLGLIPQNAKLEIAPDGTILSADGISIDTLAQMIENLKSTDYNFEDAKAFYDTCAGILTQIRTNTGETTRILNNVAANTAAISTINSAISGLKALEQSQDTHLENIESYAAAIAQALAMTEEQVNNREEIDINGYGIKHTGLVESEFVISKIPLVNQCNELVMMLIDGDYYTDSAPSFKFDADLNHDGVYEVYNALDLSFLDTPLSNTHLEDKNRFNYSVPMTIRGFLHLLIILICYISFAFKVIRKIPGLFSGGESAAEDAISRTEVTYK